MEFIIAILLSLESLIGTFFICALVYLILKRIEDKENETFEDRDF